MDNKITAEELLKLKNKYAFDRGYPNWKEYYNWICREGQFPSVTGQLIESAMDYILKHTNASTSREGMGAEEITTAQHEEFYNKHKDFVEKLGKKYFACNCTEIYTSRKMTAPDCPYHASCWEEILIDGIMQFNHSQPPAVVNSGMSDVNIQQLKVVRDYFKHPEASSEERMYWITLDSIIKNLLNE